MQQLGVAVCSALSRQWSAGMLLKQWPVWGLRPSFVRAEMPKLLAQLLQLQPTAEAEELWSYQQLFWGVAQPA